MATSEKGNATVDERARLTNSGNYGTFMLKCGKVECTTNMSAFEQCYHLVEELRPNQHAPKKVQKLSHRLLDIPDSHCHGPPVTTHDNTARNKLLMASIVCLLFTIGEAIGGYLANSLAIMTDASHMLSDFASFLISLFALWVARRPATQKMSFGYHRAEVMGAICSVLIIWVLTGVLVYLAIGRLVSLNFTIKANTMLITAAAGVCVNILMGFVLHQSGHGHSHGGLGGHKHSHSHGDDDHHDHHDEKEHLLDLEKKGGHGHGEKININVRAAFIHVLGDLVQSIGVLIAAIIIKLKPTWIMADPICTFIFSFLVLCTTITILRDALHVLMEGFPRDISYPTLVKDLQELPGVQMIHSLHVWSLTVDKNALSVHLAIEGEASAEDTLILANQMLRERYNIDQTTVQVERWQPVMENCNSCKVPGL